MGDLGGRQIGAYDVLDDAAGRWPGWNLRVTDLGGAPEIVCPRERLILVDGSCWKHGGEHGLAHAVAHLDLGHHLLDGDVFTLEHEELAETLAEIRMDREGSR